MSNSYHLSDLVETPIYHKEKLYSIVWDTGAKLPALVCDIKDIPPETYEIGVINLGDIEPFSHASIYKFKKYRKIKSKTDIFPTAIALAYECSRKVTKGEERVSFIKDHPNSVVCSKCFNKLINPDHGLENYVFCEDCCLPYHLKCEGFITVPPDYNLGRYKYVCGKCRLNYTKHPERTGKNNNSLLSQNIGINLQLNYRIPEYHIGCLYEVVWDTKKIFPGLICRCNEIGYEAFEVYLNSEIEKKIPIVYFSDKLKNKYGVVSYDDLVSFNHDSISIFKKKHTNKDDLPEFQSAVTTAFFCRAVATLKDRMNYLTEEKTGCCDCFKINIDVDVEGLDSYVYCDECLLAYHWVCAGYDEIHDDFEDPDFKYICKRCLEKV